MTSTEFLSRLQALLALPHDQQVAAAEGLIHTLPDDPIPEEWNSSFGAGSLFYAWTETSIAKQAHQHLAAAVRAQLRPGARIVEVGAGNGRTWEAIFDPDAEADLWVIDPIPEGIEEVRKRVPGGVRVHGVVGQVQEVEIPPCDLLVCSMTLHHVAGRGAEQRLAYDMLGPGKREVLQRFGRALVPTGRGFLLEADVGCDLEYAPGDPILLDHIFDSYMRRCGRSILKDALTTSSMQQQTRWAGLLRYWFLEQLKVARAPRSARDVYELELEDWLHLLSEAGLSILSHGAADTERLFVLYTFATASVGSGSSL